MIRRSMKERTDGSTLILTYSIEVFIFFKKNLGRVFMHLYATQHKNLNSHTYISILLNYSKVIFVMMGTITLIILM